MVASNCGTAFARDAVGVEQNVSVCGMALTTAVPRVLASEPSFARLSGQLGDALARNLPVSLRLSALDQCDSTTIDVESLCQALAESLDAPGFHSKTLEITLAGADLNPEIAWQLRCEHLGEGVLNLVIDEQAASSMDFWASLYRLRCEPSVRVAFWPLISAASPLLTPEVAENVLPVVGLQAPSESAWVTATLTLTECTDAKGGLDEESIVARLTDCVAVADASHDITRWPTANMRHDAWMNRRLAIRVDGLGDYVREHGLQPGNHRTLQQVRQILLRIRHALKHASQQLAKSTELLPAIAMHNPVRRLPAGPDRDSWERCWMRAVERSEVRHRNLLVLSPWSLFPVGKPDIRYMDLLPLLTLADACVFAGRPGVPHWNVNEFIGFHKRAWALMRQMEAETLVAERL